MVKELRGRERERSVAWVNELRGREHKRGVWLMSSEVICVVCVREVAYELRGRLRDLPGDSDLYIFCDVLKYLVRMQDVCV